MHNDDPYVRQPDDSDGLWEYIIQQLAIDPNFDVSAARAEDRYENSLTHPTFTGGNT